MAKTKKHSKTKKRTKPISKQNLLSPILPEHNALLSDLRPDPKRRLSLPFLAYSAAVNFHKKYPVIEVLMPTHNRKEILLAFEAECDASLQSAHKVTELFVGAATKDRMAYLNDWLSWGERLKKLLKKALYAQNIEQWLKRLTAFESKTQEQLKEHLKSMVKQPIWGEHYYFQKFGEFFPEAVRFYGRQETMRVMTEQAFAAAKAAKDNLSKMQDAVEKYEQLLAKGCVESKEYTWLRVQKKVEKHWKLLKKQGHPFPSYRSIAVDIEENAGTIKKAIQYSRSLSQAYNKDKPVGKKVKYVEPSKLDFVGVKAGRKGGKPDPIYEAEKENLLSQIKRAAQKEANDFDPDVKAYGLFVLRNMKGICTLPNEGLKDLLKDLTEKRTNRIDKIKAAFERDRLR